MTIISNQPGSATYIADDTRKWVEAYRVGNKIKPAFILKCATDSNWVNNQFIQLIPGNANSAYGNQYIYCNSIANILSPGQRLGGCLQWQTTESLDNIIQTASLT